MYIAAEATFLLVCVVAVVHTQTGDDGDIRTIAKLVSECTEKQETMVCFKMKAVKFMDRIINTPKDVDVNDYITLSRTADLDNTNATDLYLSEEELEASLPRQLDEKNSRLDLMLWQKLKALFSSRTLNIHAPIEGRGKKDKGYKGKGAMIVMMGGMMMKMMMAGVTMMSMKAMMMAKAALILAGIVALKKLGGGGHDSHPQVVYATAEHTPVEAGGGGSVSVHGGDVGGGGGGYYRRHHVDPNSLAYGSHSPDY